MIKQKEEQKLLNKSVKNAGHENKKIKLNRGVRQRDTVLSKIFTMPLEDVFKKLQWEQKGIYYALQMTSSSFPATYTNVASIE